MESLEDDDEHFETIYKWNKKRVGQIDLPRNTLTNSRSSSDSLTAAFQRIADDLVQLVENSLIRERLLFYYVYVTGYRRDDSLVSFRLALHRFHLERTSIPFDTELVRGIEDPDSTTDFEWTVRHKYLTGDILELTENPEFRNRLSRLKRSCQQTTATLKWAQKKAAELRLLIQQELNSVT